MKVKNVLIATIVCASIIGQAQCLLDFLNLSRTLALEPPNPKEVAAEVLECLRKEFEPLVVVALEAVIVLARASLVASLCLNTPYDFDAIIRPKIQVVFDKFKELQAVSASQVIEEELTEKLRCGPWNLVTQELFVVDILLKLQEKLGGSVVEDCMKGTITAVVPYAKCDKSAFSELFTSLLKLLFDRIALVGGIIGTLNVQSYFLGNACTTVPIIDLAIPLPL